MLLVNIHGACDYFSSIFFFSSRRRHTRSDRDWSSDVCSSDLRMSAPRIAFLLGRSYPASSMSVFPRVMRALADAGVVVDRSEERRVGKEGRSRWAPYH